MKYSDAVRNFSNDISKEKYDGVVWAEAEEDRCPYYLTRRKAEFLRRPLTYYDGSQYEEVRCRRKVGHKGACLNNLPYPGNPEG